MRKLKKILVFFIVLSVFAVANSQAQVIVRERPERPGTGVVVKSPAPSSHHVWVAEEWTPRGGKYVYHAGYWALPPRNYSVWVAGRWRARSGGYYWKPGYWSR